jgi:O-succinylbenzoate synthase
MSFERPIDIECVRLRRVKVPMREPFRISNGSVDEKDVIIIELESEHEIGYGEASPMSGGFYSSETPETTWAALRRDLIPDLLRSTIQSPVSFANELATYSREPFARAGLEGAVWDLSAKLLNTSIGSLFGARRRPIASGLALGIYDSIDELRHRISHYLEDGYQRVKIKIQPGWDVEPLEAIRARWPRIALMVDANGAYDPKEHAEHLKQLDRYFLMMIEQPYPKRCVPEMAELAQKLTTPLCADESAEDLQMLEWIIAERAASIVNIKVQRVGGLWNARAMHDRARRAGLECWLGTMPELGIASAQALEIATLPGFVYPTDIEESRRWYADDIISPLITIDRKGRIRVPAAGFEVDEAKLERYTVDTLEFQR